MPSRKQTVQSQPSSHPEIICQAELSCSLNASACVRCDNAPPPSCGAYCEPCSFSKVYNMSDPKVLLSFTHNDVLSWGPE